MSKTINAQVRNAPDAMLVTCDQMVAYALSRVMLASKPLSKDKFLISSIISSIRALIASLNKIILHSMVHTLQVAYAPILLSS